MNLNRVICEVLLANPVTNAADEAIMIPYMAIFLGPYFAAMIPAGTGTDLHR